MSKAGRQKQFGTETVASIDSIEPKEPRALTDEEKDFVERTKPMRISRREFMERAALIASALMVKVGDEEFIQGQTMESGQVDNLGMVRVPPIPFQMTQWRVAVLMIEPRQQTKGGVVLTNDTLDTEALLSSVGILVSMGANAFKSKTRADIHLADEPFNPKLGDYVVFAQHAGSMIQMRGKDRDIKFRLMADSDILGVTRTPEMFRYYL